MWLQAGPLPIQRGCRQCFRSGYILPSIAQILRFNHPSFSSFCLKKPRHGLSSRQKSDQTKPEPRPNQAPHPLQNKFFFLLVFINLSISLTPFAFFLRYCSGSHSVRCKLKQTCARHKPTSKTTDIQTFVHSKHIF